MEETKNTKTSKATETEVTQSNSKNTDGDKTFFADIKLKDLIADSDIQSIIEKKVRIPEVVLVKKAYPPYVDKNDKNAPSLQRVRAFFGDTVEEVIEIFFVLVGITLDPVECHNKKYRLVDCTFALNANMSDKSFTGYSATGLKLLVTHIEKVEGDTNV